MQTTENFRHIFMYSSCFECSKAGTGQLRGEKREWNKRGILQWFQLLNQSPSSKEAALEIFPPVAGIISRRAFFENWMRIRSRQTFYVNSTFDVIICCSIRKLKQLTYLILESCFHSSPSWSLQNLIHDFEYLVSKNHLASNFARHFYSSKQ